MLKKTTYLPIILLILIVTVLSACGGQATPATPTNNGNQNSDDGDALRAAPAEQPTYTAVPIDQVNDEAIEAYPAKPLPAATNLPSGYPASQPTIDAYPSGLAWVQHPVGTQCEEGAFPGFETLNDATASLKAAGIRVKEAEIIDIPAITQCGQPSSVHYRMQIAADDLKTSLSLGWTQSQ